jgi:hypothetical protein
MFGLIIALPEKAHMSRQCVPKSGKNHTAMPQQAAYRDEQPAVVEPDATKDRHRVYIIWPFRHISHKTETESADLAIAAFVQLMRMRHKSFYAIGVGWDINGKLKKYLDFGSGTLHELE